MVTPLTVSIALHYHTNGSTDFPNVDFPACVLAASLLFENGLLRKSDQRQFEATDGLEHWINALCSVPFPVQQWVIPRKE